MALPVSVVLIVWLTFPSIGRIQNRIDKMTLLSTSGRIMAASQQLRVWYPIDGWPVLRAEGPRYSMKINKK